MRAKSLASCTERNPPEIFYRSFLVRKLLRRENFTSKEHLKQRIESFIAYFNGTMAKPFRWTVGRKAPY